MFSKAYIVFESNLICKTAGLLDWSLFAICPLGFKWGLYFEYIVASVQGLYPVVREDAAQMAALQIQEEYSSALADSPEEFETAMERYLNTQVCYVMHEMCRLRPSAAHIGVSQGLR